MRRVEPGRRLHEPRGGPGVQAVRVADGDRQRRPVGRLLGLVLGRRRGRTLASGFRGQLRRLDPEVGHLAGEPAARLTGDVVERAPSFAVTAAATAPSTNGASHSSTPRRRSSGSRSSAISADRTALPEVHQHQDAVVGPRAFDRLHHQDGVGADRVIGRVEAARRLEPDVRSAHLTGELGDALGDPVAVRDDDDADHGRARQALEARTPIRTNPYDDGQDAQHEQRSRRPAASCGAESPKSNSTERSPSIAWIVTTTRKTALDHEDQRGSRCSRARRA